MCLIISGPAHKIKNALLNTEGLLLDIFKTNPDGIGVMYATKDKLKLFKKLPASLEQARHFIERLPCDERSLAIHFRWTTHGDTDLVNCHPYTVVEGEVALMHNGVLSTGNQADRTKSDTWHFIKDYMYDSVKMAPGIVFDPGYAALLRNYIGSNNRFVLMAKDGRMIILNKKEGLEHEGMWFSNSYAWTPSLLIEGYKSYANAYNRRNYSTFGDDDDYSGMGNYAGYGGWAGNRSGNWQGGGQSSGPKSGIVHNRPQLPASATPSTAPAASPAADPVSAGTSFSPTFTKEDTEIEADWEATVRRSHTEWLRDNRAVIPGGIGAGAANDDGEDKPEEGQEAAIALAKGHGIITFGPPERAELIQSLSDASVDMFDLWFGAYPTITLGLLFHLYKAEPTKWINPATNLTNYERYLYNRCLEGDKTVLQDALRSDEKNAATLAKVVCYYLNWKAWPQCIEEGSPIRGEFPFPLSRQALNDPQPVLTPDQQDRDHHRDDDDGFAERSIYIG